MALLEPDIAFRLKLLADATVSGYLSSRVYANRAPRDATFPLAVYELQLESGHGRMDGPSNLEENEYTLTVYSYNKAEAINVARACRSAISGFAGTVTSGADSLTVDGVHFEDEKDALLDVVDPQGGSRGLYAREQSYRIFSYGPE